MTRSVWKGPFVDGYLIKKADVVENQVEMMLLKHGQDALQ